MGIRGRDHKPDVNLSAVVAVESVLHEAGEPISRNEILRRLDERGRSTTRQKLNTVLKYLDSHGLIGEGSKGIQWIANRDIRIHAAIASGLRVH